MESEDVGLVRLVAGIRSGDILDGHLMAPAAGEMIHTAVAATAARATVRDIADAIHAFPTFAERLKVAAGTGGMRTSRWRSMSRDRKEVNRDDRSAACGLREFDRSNQYDFILGNLRRHRKEVRTMPTNIDRHGVQRLLEQGAQLVEVLPPAAYEEEHLPGALNIPLTQLTRATVSQFDRHRPVIVYCHDNQ